MRQCFNENANPILLPATADQPARTVALETTPELINGLNGLYLPLGQDLGIQFTNANDYVYGLAATRAAIEVIDNTSGRSVDIPTEIRNAATLTQILTGYSADFMVTKNFIESSFNADAGSSTDGVYGYYQMIPTAAIEGIEYLMRTPTADLMLEMHPEFAAFKDGMESPLYLQDPETAIAVLTQLRTDPAASSLMAAGYNMRYSASLLDDGIEPTQGHAYLLHYLGPGNFVRATRAHAENPDMIAYEALRGGEESPVLDHDANLAIFFSTDEDGTRTPRTLGEVMEHLAQTKQMDSSPALVGRTPGDYQCLEILIGDAAAQRYAETHITQESNEPAIDTSTDGLTVNTGMNGN